MKLESQKTKIFEYLYDEYFDEIYRYTYVKTRDKQRTHKIVEDIFTEIYSYKNSISSLKQGKQLLLRITNGKILKFTQEDCRQLKIV